MEHVQAAMTGCQDGVRRGKRKRKHHQHDSHDQATSCSNINRQGTWHDGEANAHTKQRKLMAAEAKESPQGARYSWFSVAQMFGCMWKTCL